MHATARLTHLLDLANKGLALRAALAEEVAELLTNWPSDCPEQMRGACEALLARAAREVDDTILARLRVCLYADPALAARVLPRPGTGRDLVEIARNGGDIAASLALALNLPRTRAEEILSDPSGVALAIACKCLRLSRAAFSTLTMLLSGKRRCRANLCPGWTSMTRWPPGKPRGRVGAPATRWRTPPDPRDQFSPHAPRAVPWS